MWQRHDFFFPRRLLPCPITDERARRSQKRAATGARVAPGFRAVVLRQASITALPAKKRSERNWLSPAVIAGKNCGKLLAIMALAWIVPREGHGKGGVFMET